MGMLMDAIKGLADMSKLSKLQDAIESELNQLEADGKLPDDLKNAFETLKNAKGNGQGSVEDSLEPLKDFVEKLEAHKDILPENIQNIVDKFAKVEEDLEGISERVDEASKK